MHSPAQSKKTFDAVVIGSGATGGWAAQILCEGGLEVAVLESGSALEGFVGEGDGSTRANCRIQKKCSAYNRNTSRYFVDDDANPYVTPPEKPFSWIRSHVVGGKTVLWAGQCYRMIDLDFKAASHDGFGEDWPVTHEQLAPSYARAERALHLTGSRDGIPQVPDSYARDAEPL